jgi:hypothetical protein
VLVERQLLRVFLIRRGITDQIPCFRLLPQLVEAEADLRIPVLRQEKLVVVGVVLAVERLTHNLAGPELPDKETAALVCGIPFICITAAVAAAQDRQRQTQPITFHQTVELGFVVRLQANVLFMPVGVVEEHTGTTLLLLDKAALEVAGQEKTPMLRLVKAILVRQILAAALGVVLPHLFLADLE